VQLQLGGAGGGGSSSSEAARERERLREQLPAASHALAPATASEQANFHFSACCATYERLASAFLAASSGLPAAGAGAAPTAALEQLLLASAEELRKDGNLSLASALLPAARARLVGCLGRLYSCLPLQQVAAAVLGSAGAAAAEAAEAAEGSAEGRAALDSVRAAVGQAGAAALHWGLSVQLQSSASSASSASACDAPASAAQELVSFAELSREQLEEGQQLQQAPEHLAEVLSTLARVRAMEEAVSLSSSGLKKLLHAGPHSGFGGSYDRGGGGGGAFGGLERDFMGMYSGNSQMHSDFLEGTQLDPAVAAGLLY
jgi:hypothetical protein